MDGEMTERLQLALDGDQAARQELNDSERATLLETEKLIAGIVRSVPTRPLPDLSAAVMSRLPASASPAAATSRDNSVLNAISWLWAPRPVQWRPAYGIAMVALLAVFGTLRLTTADAPIAATQEVLVEFRLEAPDAKQVQLAGNFSNWKPAHAMKRSAAGTWTVVVPMTPGVHNYGFVVDGDRWVVDPTAQAVSDGFGGVNSQLAVLSPEQSRSL